MHCFVVYQLFQQFLSWYLQLLHALIYKPGFLLSPVKPLISMIPIFSKDNFSLISGGKFKRTYKIMLNVFEKKNSIQANTNFSPVLRQQKVVNNVKSRPNGHLPPQAVMLKSLFSLPLSLALKKCLSDGIETARRTRKLISIPRSQIRH